MKKEFELYEIIYLVKPNFTQQEVAAKSEYYQNFLTKQGSQVLAQNKGKRTLSYPIKGFESAHYIQMVYHGNKTLINSLRQESKIFALNCGSLNKQVTLLLAIIY